MLQQARLEAFIALHDFALHFICIYLPERMLAS